MNITTSNSTGSTNTFVTPTLSGGWGVIFYPFELIADTFIWAFSQSFTSATILSGAVAVLNVLLVVGFVLGVLS